MREEEQIVADPQPQVVMKELLGAGLLHDDCLTVTGRTVAENLRDTPTISDLKSQVHSWEREKNGREEGKERGEEGRALWCHSHQLFIDGL